MRNRSANWCKDIKRVRYEKVMDKGDNLPAYIRAVAPFLSVASTSTFPASRRHLTTTSFPK